MKSAEKFTNSLRKETLLKKAQMLEHPDISQRKEKQLKFAKPKSYILTQEKDKYCLWEELN